MEICLRYLTHQFLNVEALCPLWVGGPPGITRHANTDYLYLGGNFCDIRYIEDPQNQLLRRGL